MEAMGKETEKKQSKIIRCRGLRSKETDPLVSTAAGIELWITIASKKID